MTSETLYAAFTTAKQHYLYDTATNQILGASPVAWAIADDVIRHDADVAAIAATRDDLTASEIEAARSDIQTAQAAGFFQPCTIQKMQFCDDEADLMHRVRHQVRHLTLELTERCNLRCHYCAHTYNDSRVVEPRDISWPTIQNALEQFARSSDEAEDRAISFWGGEPLRRFDLIARVAATIRTQYPELRPTYSFTTNGTLITGRIAQFLSANQVQLLVSVDGPREIHDRNRTTSTGHGSFDMVMAGLRRLRDTDPEYFRRHVRFNCVVTSQADLALVSEFFADNELTRDCGVILNGVSTDGLPARECLFYQKRPASTDETVKRLVGGSNDDWLADSMRRRLLNIAFRRRGALTAAIPLNGCCVPLRKKMLVTVTGEIHMCERVPYQISLGNVNTGGVDYDRVLNLVRSYAANSLPDCCRCWAVRLCSACYRDFMRDGGWDGSDRAAQCESRRRALLCALRGYATVIEHDPLAFDKYKNVTFAAPL